MKTVNSERLVQVQVGTIGIRDPKDRYKIVENIPIYAEMTIEDRERSEETMCNDRCLARMFAEKFKAYMDGCAEAGLTNG